MLDTVCNKLVRLASKRAMLNGNVLGFEARVYPGIRVQRLAKVGAPGLVNSIPAVAYHLCPNLPAAFTRPGALTLADLSTTMETSETQSFTSPTSGSRIRYQIQVRATERASAAVAVVSRGQI